MNIKTNLNAPFPFVDRTQDKILVSVLFATFIYVFLILFQPFGIANITFYKPIFVLGYGGITFLVMISSFFLYPKLFANFDKDKWTVKKMFFYILFQILLIAIFNWTYNLIVGKEIVEQHSLVMFVFITFSVGSIPTLFFILLVERFLFLKNEKKANKLTQVFSEMLNTPFNTAIEIGSSQSKLSLHLSDILCVKAEGNYVEIYSIEDSQTRKHLLRCSLTKIKNQLEAHAQFKHCHRSFIVNTQHLIKLTGNARNFNLHLNYLSFSIPVSRSFPIHTIKK